MATNELAAILARRRARNGDEEVASVSVPAAHAPVTYAPVHRTSASSEVPAKNDSEQEGQNNTRRASSKIQQLQGNLGAFNMNAFRLPGMGAPMPRKSTTSIMTTGEDYAYESTMKMGVAMPGMQGIPMPGLAKTGMKIPGINTEENTTEQENTPLSVAHVRLIINLTEL